MSSYIDWQFQTVRDSCHH